MPNIDSVQKWIKLSVLDRNDYAAYHFMSLDIRLGGTKLYPEYQSVLGTFICYGMGNGRFASTLVRDL